jgi:hypothetical protein
MKTKMKTKMMLMINHGLSCLQWQLAKDKWEQLEQQGILDVTLLPSLWPQSGQHKAVLLGLMHKLDLLCPLASSQASVASFSLNATMFKPVV